MESTPNRTATGWIVPTVPICPAVPALVAASTASIASPAAQNPVVGPVDADVIGQAAVRTA
jgi:hypothetical protein